MKTWWIPPLCVAVDQGLKALVAAAVPSETVLIPGLLTLSPMLNPGISFGMLGDSPWAGIAVSVLCMVFLLLYVKKARPGRLGMMSFLVVLGGFAGNLLDRFFLGAVFDFLYFPFLPLFVCNPADIMICGGMVLLCLSILLKKE